MGLAEALPIRQGLCAPCEDFRDALRGRDERRRFADIRARCAAKVCASCRRYLSVHVPYIVSYGTFQATL